MSKSKSRPSGVPLRFGPPPILPGEDHLAYERMLKQVFADIQPTDIVEKIYLQDVFDLTWEIQRWRRAKNNLIAYEMELLMESEEEPGTEDDGVEEKSESETDDEEKGRAQEDESNEPLDEDDDYIEHVMRIAFVDNIDQIDRIDSVISALENRRNSLLYEIQRRRESFAHLLRLKLHEIEDTKFETLPTNERRKLSKGAQ